MNRYLSTADEYEPGSNGLVLKNHLGITRIQEIEQLESRYLAENYADSLTWMGASHPFDLPLIKEMHRLWLGEIYPMAGKLRTVTISKGGFLFCHPDFIERELMRLCDEVLLDFPKTIARLSEDEKIPIVAEQVAISHSELMLIHPFREGNGRLGRWIADLMVLQAGLRIPAYNLSTEANRQNYFRALRRGFAGDFT